MPPDPGRVRETWAVTPSRRSSRVSRKPVFMASATTRVATPAATPRTLKTVTRRRTTGRFGDRRYRLATNQAKSIAQRRSAAVAFGFPLAAGVGFGPQLRKQDDVADGMRVR